MIRTFAGPVEADLAFTGVDFRDFYRPGGGSSGLSMRRLLALISALPYESATHTQIRAAQEAAKSEHRHGRIRHYANLKATQEREAS